MIGGGHFAASIFNKNEVIQHKTFHSYTVRAKQGGSQSMKDNKQSASKSAGASLRRYNERSLMQHVQEILANWSKDIAGCHFVFIRAVGPNNQSILFSGKQASLQKNDPRIRKIPFPTRRATFNETRRVHSLLTSIDVYKSESVFQSKFLGWSTKSNFESEVKEKSVDKPKPKPSKKPKPVTLSTPEESLSNSVTQLDIKSDNSDHGEKLSETDNIELSSSEVASVEQGDKKQVRKKKKKKIVKELETKPEEHILKFRVDVLTACTNGNVDGLKEVLDSKGDNISDEEVVIAMNQMAPDNVTLLQFAAQNSFNEIVHLVLLNGGDPCAKNAKSMTAYDFATEKETRNVFRRFMGDYPDRYDYSKSHIPSALTDDAKERQKAVKKAKRMREKERKKADEPRKAEIAEQKRFLQLDDREKRALAAERRIQASLGKSGKDLVLLRCYRCAINITGKVPFHYESFSFCSMQCLKEHRQSSQTSSNEISR
ncbi:ankyrin repeat and zinc finger domain-containing protein 1 [Nilaparvata lugens]|uniref:ankyrin repeat and zinc finger domain-containing protein 1 n=1 Tax=Nilaparvata lugens TaxID=108931 RepID=UPI00193E1E38|nr:ankyrin repeat and zinc finger domain-containing protein 1 [Nilaparvata lugens]